MVLQLVTWSTHKAAAEPVLLHLEFQARTQRQIHEQLASFDSSETKWSGRREEISAHPTTQQPKPPRPPVPQRYSRPRRKKAASHPILHSSLDRRVPYRFVHLRHLRNHRLHSPAGPPEGLGAEVAEVDHRVGHTSLPRQTRFRRFSTQQPSMSIAAKPFGTLLVPDKRATCIMTDSRSASRSSTKR